MSRQAADKYIKTNGSKRQQSSGVRGNFIAFHPTEAEKKAITAANLTAEQALDALQVEVERGLSFGISRTRTNDAFCITIKPLAYTHGIDQCLAAFHSDLTRLMGIVVYLLTTKYPQWPEEPVKAFQEAIDW